MEKKQLSKRPTRIQRKGKRTAAQVKRDNATRVAAMQEFPPKPVNFARTIAARLKNIRDREGISLSVLAERTGMTRANLSRFENTSKDFRVSTLKRYADGLGIVVAFTIEDGFVVMSGKTKKSQPASTAHSEDKQ